MRKLFIMGAVALTMLTATGAAYAGTDVNPDITLDGQKVQAEAYIKGGTTYVPVRTISELVGTEIKWDKQKQAVLLGETSDALYQCIDNSNTDNTVKNDGKFYANHSVRVYKNGTKVSLQDVNGSEVFAQMRSGVNYLPVRSISNAFGLDVKWNNATKTVVLSHPHQDIPEIDVPSTSKPEGYKGGTYLAAGWKSSALSSYSHRAKLEVASYDATEDHAHGIWRTYTDNDFSTYMNDYGTDTDFVKYEITERAEAHTWMYAIGSKTMMERPEINTNLGRKEIRNTYGKTLKLVMEGNGSCPNQEYMIPNGDAVILMAMKDGSGAECYFYDSGTGALVSQFCWDAE